jgi:molybdate transport system substrate-binding protein
VKKLPLTLILLPLLQTSAAELHVFAAASLSDALREVAANFEKETGTKVKLNFGASNMLARQIEEGAPADVFLSADEAKMDQLAAKNLIDPATRKDLLGNSLVVVVSADSALTINSIKDLLQPGVRRLALADPQAVPAGIYAREYLSRQALFDQLRERVLPTENVRAALAAVESGNADVAILYKTDAPVSKRVRVAFQVPAVETPAINYPVAILQETKVRAEAEQFVRQLRSPAATRVFEGFGFIVKP